ncbi:MAG TPA: CehA/McbA family metallohydrolase [Vicinamibacterales bacterium]|nr:CehA/McbA family metallohydrolase [Vicinamibacterales bacterium]
MGLPLIAAAIALASAGVWHDAAPAQSGDAPLTITRRYLPADRLTGRYQYVPIDVPAGATRIRIEQQYDRADGANAVDLGLMEPGSLDLGSRALRGWSGGARTEIELTPATATPGYRPGPLPAGRWHVIVGLYKVAPDGVEVTLRVAIETAPRGAQSRRWYSGDLHLHTVHSDGNSEPAQVLELARQAGLDFAAITDHNNTTHALAHPPDPSGRPLHIVGEEITTPGGHANVWGLKPGDWIDFRLAAGDARIEALAAEAQARGALFSINHPSADCDACDWRLPVPSYLTAVEVWNGHKGPQPAAIELWDELLRSGRRVTGVASSDWHRPPARVGVPSVRVLAEALTSEQILGAIRSGAVVMMRDPVSPPPVVHVSAGATRAGVGESLVTEANADLEITVDVPGFTSEGLEPCPSRCTVELSWNGVRVDASPAAGGRVSFRRPAADGYFRVAVLSQGTVVALTNPVFVITR